MFKLYCHAYSGEDSEGKYDTLEIAQQAMSKELAVEIKNLQNELYEEKYEYDQVVTDTSASLYVKNSDIYFEWSIVEINKVSKRVNELKKVNFKDLFSDNREFTDITIYCNYDISQSVFRILSMYCGSVNGKYRKNRATLHGTCHGSLGKSIKVDWNDIDWTNSLN